MNPYSESEAHSMITAPKEYRDPAPLIIEYRKGFRRTFDLYSSGRQGQFKIDIYFGWGEKMTFQLRVENVILVRLDIGYKPHRNPDFEKLSVPHLHLYREGYESRWAYPLPAYFFPCLHDPEQTLEAFLQFCSVTKKPIIHFYR
ncbi:MAG: hypothetical protein NZ933_09205 [Bacteroidia bacterium]|nr:hypothetical protein [Bacteroidia bacterium]